MAWLKTLQKQYGNRATIDRDRGRLEGRTTCATIAASLKPNYRIVMGTPEVIKAFGAVAAVPKLLVFDRAGPPIAGALRRAAGSAPADRGARSEERAR